MLSNRSGLIETEDAEGYILDSSVVMKWFSAEDEPYLKEALLLRRGFLEQRWCLAIPDLVLYEVANVLHIKTPLTVRDVENALASLELMGLEVIFPELSLLCRAVFFAEEWGLSVYDAVFVALAEGTGFPLITADAECLRKLDGHRLPENLQVYLLQDLGLTESIL